MIYGRRDMRGFKHGMRYTREYKVWLCIIGRCTNPRNTDYARYGGRGISMCAAWRKSFLAFFEAVGIAPSPKHELDRIDNNGNYEPGNVRWATRKEQCNNKANNRLLAFDGQTRTLADWARALNLSYGTIWTRMDQGLAPELVLYPGNLRYRKAVA